jgi:hypothetical protein
VANRVFLAAAMTPACPWRAGQDPVTAVEPFAQQIRVAIVPGVLLVHVDMHRPHAHTGVAVRMVEGLIQVLAAGRARSISRR